ncbi:MAG: CDP-alcohol phosphatidyltransferase family protein [Ardenticatenaceae bacterium]|nr:CDP-alcohol phosphatidyltransferase family protein [Ardenticatenaceae bacterium]
MNKRVLAWSVHLFTASGAVVGLLTIFAIMDHRWLAAILWMSLAAVIDSLDGTLARRFQVKGVTPNFDGALLDNIIDYFTYAVIPALFIYEAGLLPESWALLGASVIVLTSGYQFCQLDAKTADHFFKGFPSYWNVLAYYLLFLQLSPWTNLVVILTCGILVFVPIKFIYPSRMSRFQKLTLVLSAIWGIMNLIVIFQYPDIPLTLLRLSLLYLVYYIVMSFYLAARSPNLPDESIEDDMGYDPIQ